MSEKKTELKDLEPKEDPKGGLQPSTFPSKIDIGKITEVVPIGLPKIGDVTLDVEGNSFPLKTVSVRFPS